MADLRGMPPARDPYIAQKILNFMQFFCFFFENYLRNLIFVVEHCRMVAKYIYLTIIVEDDVHTRVHDRWVNNVLN